MDERQLWQLFLETGAPEVYLEYRQEHAQAAMGPVPSVPVPAIWAGRILEKAERAHRSFENKKGERLCI